LIQFFTLWFGGIGVSVLVLYQQRLLKPETRTCRRKSGSEVDGQGQFLR
jgi:hypothetical protein